MRKIYSFLFCLLFLTLAKAQGTAVGWNFNTSTLTASTGTGTISFVGGAGSPTYVNNGGTQALAFADFPLATVGSGTAGIRFTTSTVGFSGISITFDAWGHNQSSRWQQFEYTTDGTNWTILSNNNGTLSPTSVTTTLNFPASCNNNTNFAFRIVSIFNPSGGTEYEQVQGGGYNGNNGKWYFDNVGISYASLGVKDNAIAGLKVYPNPAKTSLLITSDALAVKNVEIFNTIGAKVLTAQVNNSEINVSSLKTGVYTMKVIENDKIATRKLVIE